MFEKAQFTKVNEHFETIFDAVFLMRSSFLSASRQIPAYGPFYHVYTADNLNSQE